MTRKIVPGLLCVLVLCGILVAGLVPFQRPRNSVTWLGNENGLHFGKHGTVWSTGPLTPSEAPTEASCSLEMRLQPSFANASNTILAFYTPHNPVRLTVHQYHALLILQREHDGSPHHTEVIGITDTFHPARPVFVTITSGPQKTAIYVNGTLVKPFPSFRMGNDCAGQVIIGTSPDESDSWAGELRGLAIYGQELRAAEVLQHYEAWTTQGRPEISADEHPIGVYLFDERAGSVIHNAMNDGINLNIPERFSLVHEQFLKPFWLEFRPTRGYVFDVLVNIAGFIPLGFVFFGYWTSVRPIKRPALATVALGFAVSLTIEVLQSYLPTRDSGTTDLITNTLGTFFGVRLYASSAARALVARLY
jgi:VanZ family protein